MEQQQAKDKVLAALDNIPAVRQILQTVSDENMARDVGNKLKIATEGTEFYIKIPADKNTYPKEMIEKVDNNIKERLPEILASLTEGVIKYITKNLQHEGKSEQEIVEAVEKAKVDMVKLKTAVNIGNDNNLSVTIRSPEQEEAIKTRTGSSWEVPNNADELKASNPLNELSSTLKEHEKQENPDASPQFNKALSRAFLYGGGEKAMEVFPLIAGRRDIYNAINKEAKKFPEKTQQFQEILASDLFKKHGWGIEKDEAGAAPAKPLFRKNILNQILLSY